MSRRYLLIILIIPFILFFTTCRNSLTELSSEKASLSIGISISRSLYNGDFGVSADRYIALSSETLSVSFLSGSTTVSGSAVLELDPENPDKLTGVVTLDNLPVGQEGTVFVETFTANDILVCDGSDTVTITSGENSVFITLSISQDSPLLENLAQSRYLLADLPRGEDRFIRIGPLDAGRTYSLFTGPRGIDYEVTPSLNVITDDGTSISFDSVNDGDSFNFTPSENDSYAIFNFYNPSVYDIQGVLWWDEAADYSQLVSTNRIDLTNLVYTSIWNGQIYPIAADNGRFFLGNQNYEVSGLYEYTDDGTTWSYVDAWNIVDTSITGLSPSNVGIGDITADSGYLFMGLFYIYSTVAQYFDLNLSIRDQNSVYNHEPSHPSPIEYVSADSPPIANIRISHSGSHIALGSVDPSGNLSLSMADLYPGYLGSFSTITYPSFDINPAIDNLAIAARENQCFLLGTSGSIYRYEAGDAFLSSTPVTSIGVNSSTDRHLNILNDQYLIASSTEESAVYLPDENEKIVFYDDSDRPADIQLLWDSGYTTVDFHMFASQGALLALMNMYHPSLGWSFSLSLSLNGGLSWINSGHIDFTGAASVVIGDAIYDASTGEVYLSVLEDQGNLEYKIYTLQLQ